jgi:glycosyltransferase involved in cell wall biosynthesis
MIFTGGVENRTFNLSNYLTRNRHKVRILKRTNRYEFNSPIAVAERLFFFLKLLAGLIFVRSKFDVVEGTNFVTHLLAFLYARATGAKAVAWYPDVFIGHGVNRLGLMNGTVTEIVERLAVRLPWDGVSALSKETKKKLIKAGVDEKKIRVIYGGVELNSEFRIQNSELHKFKHPTIICIARLVKYKRVQDLLLAIYFLRKKFTDIRVMIVGGGPEKKNLSKLCAQLMISSSVVWKKGISEGEKAEFLSRSHVAVSASVVEGFGLVTVEALACGTPVVNVNIAINREILRSQESGVRSQEFENNKIQVRGGLLFNPEDPVDLAEKIETLLIDKKLYNQKVSEGKELVKQYDLEKVNKQTERFYQHLLSH